MAKVVRVKRKPEKKQDSGKQIQKTLEFKHGFMVGLKDDYRELTWEDAQERIRKALEAEFPGGRFTPVGGLILIDGKACYPHDFDYEAMDRKPGTHPPLYTLTREEQELVKVEERIARESKNPNTLARNPTNLLTSRETDTLRKIRSKGLTKQETREAMGDSVEWTEEDINDDELVAQETKKALRKITVKKTAPAPVRKKVIVKRARG